MDDYMKYITELLIQTNLGPIPTATTYLTSRGLGDSIFLSQTSTDCLVTAIPTFYN